jgi:penicillin G amidase
MGIPGWGRAGALRAQTEQPELFALAVAWTSGVNRRIDEVLAGDAPMPYGFTYLDYMPERWSVVDAFAIGKLLLFGNANLIEYEILATILKQYLPDLYANFSLFQPLEPSFTMPPDERPASPTLPMGTSAPAPLPRRELPADFASRMQRFSEKMAPFRPGASNNWAIGGEHTFNGRPLIASDPHQPLESPSLFWVHHLNSADAGGMIDTIGFNFAGTPAIQLGHNRRVAWTATTTYPDNQDLYDVRATSAYAMVEGRGVILMAHDEMIQVRGEATPRQVRVERVPGYGVLLPEDLAPLPIVSEPGRNRLLYVWTGFRPTNEFSIFRRYATAATAADVADAAGEFEIGTFNWVSADADGVAYRSGMLVPDRGMPTTRDFSFTVRDGTDLSTYWTGEWLSRDELMDSTGGARGWIATANNDPFGFTQDGEVIGDPWYYGVFFDPGTRGMRIDNEITRLTARGPGSITIEDMEALQTDTFSIFADRLIPLIEAAWGRVDTEMDLMAFRGRADLATLVALLGAWDRHMDRDEAAPVAYDAFVFNLIARALGDDFAAVFEPVLSASTTTMMKWTTLAVDGSFPNGDMLLQEGRDVLILSALSDASLYLTDRFGGPDPAINPYTWGDIHGTRFDNPAGGMLDGGWVPTDGADGTVNVSDANFFASGDTPMRLESGAGPIYRTIYSFDDDGTPRATTNFPRGVAGEPDSPHWADTLDDWVAGTYRPLLFRRAEIEADSPEITMIMP